MDILDNEAIVFAVDAADVDNVINMVGATSIAKDANGAPYFVGSDLKMSLSHKDDLVVIAVANTEIGVDVENVTAEHNFERLAKLFHQDENPQNAEEFYEIWTEKEAMGKLLKTGVTREILGKKASEVCHLRWGDYTICVAGVKSARFYE